MKHYIPQKFIFDRRFSTIQKFVAGSTGIIDSNLDLNVGSSGIIDPCQYFVVGSGGIIYQRQQFSVGSVGIIDLPTGSMPMSDKQFGIFCAPRPKARGTFSLSLLSEAPQCHSVAVHKLHGVSGEIIPKVLIF